jgi:cytochrome c
MNARTLLAGIVAIGLLGTSSFACAQPLPPQSARSKKIVAMVNKAAELIERKGQSVFPEFRKPGSEWLSGDTYLFVIDMKGFVLLNGGFPNLEGVDQILWKDTNGKEVVVEMIKVVRSNGSGWVNYVWVKPGHTESTQKWSYVKASKVDGTPAFVGAGFYSE